MNENVATVTLESPRGGAPVSVDLLKTVAAGTVRKSVLEIIRHQSVFNADAFNVDHEVSVIGCGATGSKVVKSLAAHGVGNINVWDFDKIESHNIPNQEYLLKDIGRSKTIALRRLIKAKANVTIKVNRKFIPGKPLQGVVFLLTDTMKSRVAIWNKSIRLRPQVKLLIETRMGADQYRVYTVNPINADHIKGYEGTFCKDEEATDSLCGAPVSVGATADALASESVWQLFRWFAMERGGEDVLQNEILRTFRPPMLVTRQFKG